jgi:hypothetical protein
VTDEISCTINNEMHVGGLFCDLAIDCVNSDILLFKLNFYGIRGEAEQWFKSYLNDRKQKVEIKYPNSNNNTYSEQWFKSYFNDRKQKVEIKYPNSNNNTYSDWENVEVLKVQCLVLGFSSHILMIYLQPSTLSPSLYSSLMILVLLSS